MNAQEQLNPFFRQRLTPTQPMKTESLKQPTTPTKINEQFPGCFRFLKQAMKNSTGLIGLLLGMLFGVASASAQFVPTLTWDAGNTNNGATIDTGDGFWDVTHSATNFSASTTTTATTNVNLVAGGIDWFQVNVPANALAATNILLFATNLPVNVWFSTTQTTNNVGDTLLMAGVSGGVSVLTTNLASAPTNIVQGGTYYIGIDNAANANPVGYALKVDLSLTNAVTVTSTLYDWNNGSGNVNWTQTSTTVPLVGNAIFPATAGNTVTLDGGQICVSNLTINGNYTFAGSTLYARSIGSLGLTQGQSCMTFINDGLTVVFSNNLAMDNSIRGWQLGNGGAPSTMVLYGN